MIYMPVKHLRPGMIVGRSILYDSTLLPLIAAGQALTNTHIAKLKELLIHGIYVESKLCSDIDADEFVDPKVKQQISTDLKVIYRNFSQKKAISPANIQSVTDMAERLLSHILSKNEQFMSVFEIKEYDEYTFSHSIYVATLCILIGTQLNYSYSSLTELAMAGLLHDIGKVDIPIEITNKPGALTDEEFAIMQTHPFKAVQKLRVGHQISTPILKAIESHHEKYNGTGYPHGLSGNQIPTYGRILALADVYDALTSTRSYRPAWSSNEAIEYMMGCANTHFDFDLLQAFLKTIAAYPIGTIVELSNGSYAIVSKISPDHILRPVVKIIVPDNPNGVEVDLANDSKFLDVTIIGTITDSAVLPDGLV